jgi:Rieske Fe-S protein
VQHGGGLDDATVRGMRGRRLISTDVSAPTPEPEVQTVERPVLLGRGPFIAMAAALAASYGTLLAFMARFLFPARGRSVEWAYVVRLSAISRGDTVLYKTPAGETVNVTRLGDAGAVDDFVALSSVCPHLGCQVHWEPQKDRYFCPCHNGVFTPEGVAIAGPPAEAGQSLSRYPLKIEHEVLYIQAPIERLPVGVGAAPELRGPRGALIEVAGKCRGEGHDPCLAAAYRQRKS